MMDGHRKMTSRRSFLLSAVALFSSVPLVGCLEDSMGRSDVTERDIEVARQMGAPDDVIETLERGKWGEYRYEQMVRNAEACIDYLEGRYGERFLARMSELRNPMHDYVVVDLEVGSGPFVGEPVTVHYYSTGEHEDSPRFDESYYCILHREEWERLASEAIVVAIAGLPEGSVLARAELPNAPVVPYRASLPVTEGGGGGIVDIAVCEPLAGSSREELETLSESLERLLGEKGLAASYTVWVFDEVPEGGFTLEWAMDNRHLHSYYFDGETTG